MSDSERRLIRNSTAEFLTITGGQGCVQSIEARHEDETAPHAVEKGGRE